MPLTDSILTRPVPSTGEILPVIGLGTWRTFDVGRSAADRAPLEQCLTAFVSLGGTLIDSSPMYGRSEEVVGDLAEKLGLRSRLFVATKVWTSGKRRGIEQMRSGACSRWPPSVASPSSRIDRSAAGAC